MIKVGVFEVARVLMAGITCPGIMVRRCPVTGRTILPANGGVIEIDIAEVARVLMASRASTRIVIGRRTVTSRAILPTNR